MSLRLIRLPVLLTTVAATALLLTSCSGGGTSASSSSPSASSSSATGSITVFAAASLQKTFTELGKQYETAHPGTTIAFSFAGSSDLVTQIQNGAPADVFASADEANMEKLAASDLEGSAQDFAKNTLEIAVAPGNPKKITDFKDLTNAGVQVVTCAAPVPCGAAAQKVEQATGITLQPVSEEQSVTDVLGKVSSGQADAGLVYVTDVKGAAGKVDGVTFKDASSAINTYPIAVLKESTNPDLAGAFDDFVRSSAGHKVLQAAGFQAP
ncbi:molybdate transport system substrate-binding protein [Curtobacterium sp. PhB25]|uniref:molybdate ABC transporter substrate-binding protein n=1 Tax=Curtobacterium sp. PhB25 TaxID=2485205 RepID=UPI001064F175|nr:molybdate ABC transporter substrate-binding protein [Curtobacterium sp. PhB25]TDW64179.1 molybdate transport system substrate-binding protein [Curtobacterium sp. PhB25]